MSSGRVLFRIRPLLPILGVLALVFCRWRESNLPNLPLWGGVFVVLGAALRFWSVGHVGKATRASGSETVPLARGGPYRFVRNPIYWGNLLIASGLIVSSKLLWILPVYLAIFWLTYIPIVVWEEQVLGGAFGAAYQAYCAQVPRWLPKLSLRAGQSTSGTVLTGVSREMRTVPDISAFRWGEALRFERLIWLEIVLVAAALALKVQ